MDPVPQVYACNMKILRVFFFDMPFHFDVKNEREQVHKVASY